MKAAPQMFGWADPVPRELRFPAVDVENIHRNRKPRQGSLAHDFHFFYKKYEKSSLLSTSLSLSDVASGKGWIENCCWDLPIKGEK